MLIQRFTRLVAIATALLLAGFVPAPAQAGDAEHPAEKHQAAPHQAAPHQAAEHHDEDHESEGHHNGPFIEVGLVNQRLWRGFVENDTPSMQPKIGYHYKGFAIMSFSNIAHTGKHSQNWTEHELELEYERRFGRFTLLGGYIHYSFPDIAGTTDDTHAPDPHEPDPHEPEPTHKSSAAESGGTHYPRYTQEFFGGVKYHHWLNPSVRVYRDFHARNGTYYYLSMDHPFVVRRRAIVRPLLGLGVNQGLIIHNTTVSNFETGVAVDFPTGRAVFSPFYKHSLGHASLFGNHHLFGMTISAR